MSDSAPVFHFSASMSSGIPSDNMCNYSMFPIFCPDIVAKIPLSAILPAFFR